MRVGEALRRRMRNSRTVQYTTSLGQSVAQSCSASGNLHLIDGVLRSLCLKFYVYFYMRPILYS